MGLWERGIHAGLVGDAEAEGATQECRVSRRGEEEEDAFSQKPNSTVLSGKL